MQVRVLSRVPTSRNEMKYLIIISTLLLTNCAYTGTKDPNIQFWDIEPVPQYEHPRTTYFKDNNEY